MLDCNRTSFASSRIKDTMNICLGLILAFGIHLFLSNWRFLIALFDGWKTELDYHYGSGKALKRFTVSDL